MGADIRFRLDDASALNKAVMVMNERCTQERFRDGFGVSCVETCI